jgi:hypothetical protein
MKKAMLEVDWVRELFDLNQKATFLERMFR